MDWEIGGILSPRRGWEVQACATTFLLSYEGALDYVNASKWDEACGRSRERTGRWPEPRCREQKLNTGTCDA